MRTAGRARRGTRATTACRWRQRVVPRDAGYRRQRVLSRLSGREPGTFASRLVQFAITRVAVPRHANGPNPESPLGVHKYEFSGDRREHPHTARQVGREKAVFRAVLDRVSPRRATGGSVWRPVETAGPDIDLTDLDLQHHPDDADGWESSACQRIR